MWDIVISVLATALVVFIGMNFHRPEKDVRRKVEHRHAVADPQFRREMNAMLGPDVLDGNRVTLLQNGDEIFPPMLAAIRAARRSICFETYIYWSGEIGQVFADALKERAQAGVPVHVMLDWAGSMKMEQGLLDELVAAGVDLRRYHPIRWYSISRLNNRTHRKLLVVDGSVGFTGGVGIADTWLGHAQDPQHWRDLHFRIEGPVVGQLQAGFMDNWIKTTGLVLHGGEYYPPLGPVGTEPAQLFVSSPAGGSASMHLMYLLAVAAATRSIDLQAAYFIPGAIMVDALVAARGRGARVRILVPGKYIDSAMVRVLSRRVWKPLLEAGVEIHEYQPTMMHNKMLVIDGHMASVGSTNFDMRSFELNDEASLNIYDDAFGARMTAVMEADLEQSTPYTLEMWRQRPWSQRVAELLVLPFKSQL